MCDGPQTFGHGMVAGLLDKIRDISKEHRTTPHPQMQTGVDGVTLGPKTLLAPLYNGMSFGYAIMYHSDNVLELDFGYGIICTHYGVCLR